MKLALFAYSRRGCETARSICGCFPEDEIQRFTMEKFGQPDFLPLKKADYRRLFDWADGLIFVGACGIAVRQIAPYVKDKTTDPAVLCVDELAHFVIPLLSGHIGGANLLADRLARHLGATAVITTATDINRRFSVDAWAARQGLVIGSMAAAKAVSAAILERDIPICTEFPVRDPYPAGTYPSSTGQLGICIGWQTADPFPRTLHLIPRVLHLGIGCRKGTPESAIAQAVDAVLEENRIDHRAVGSAASIDLKAGEPGLLSFCRSREIPIRFYAGKELAALAGEFSCSPFVQQVAGVDCVCERAAMMDADRLIVKKTARNGVTVAIAAERYEVCFG